MTPEEEALLREKLGMVSPSLDYASSFRERVLGVPQVVRAGEVMTGTTPGTPLALSRKAAATVGETVQSPGGVLTRPMDTPLAEVSPAPQLNPALSKVGRPMGGGPGGGFGGLRDNYEYALKRERDGLVDQQGLTGDLGAAQRQRTEALAELEHGHAMQMVREAEKEKRVAEDTYANHQKVLEQQSRLIDEIGKAKPDARRYMRNMSTASTVAWTIGAVADGWLRGAKGIPNEALNRLDQEIERDIRMQVEEIDNKKASVQAKHGLVGQLMQVSGDRRLAADQARRLAWEGVRTDIKAKADLLGIPAAQVEAELAQNAVGQKIGQLDTNVAKAGLDYAQRAAAAAQAARDRAEHEAWERAKWVAEFGLKKDAQEIDRAKALGVTGEDFNKQAQSLSKELADKDLAEGRATVNNLKRRLDQAKPGEGLPGVGQMGDFRDKLRPEGWQNVLPGMHLANAVAGLSPEERVTRGDWNKLKLDYQHKITGSGASNEERAMLSSAFEGARTPAEQRAAINLADDYFKRREAAFKAGYDPRVVRAVEDRIEGRNPSLPKSVEIKK